MLRKIGYAAAAALILGAGWELLGGGNEYRFFLQWWIVILGVGLLYFPITEMMFSTFEDGGYLFAKTIGIAISGYLMWLLSSLHILKFNIVSCYIVIGLGALLNIGVFLSKRFRGKKNHIQGESVNSTAKRSVDLILFEELLFLLIFLLLTYMKGFRPEAQGTEKFMDYGFMTSILRSDYMPPQDFWFAGSKLNYYYVGQFIASFLTRLTFTGPQYGYNLMLMATGAFAFVLPFSIVYQLISSYMVKEKKLKRRILSMSSGLMAGIGVSVAGTMYYPIFRHFIPWIQKNLIGEGGGRGYWFPNATRYIGYVPETNDKTIHEFPSYSIILGDLHAHVINILFVLTIMGILLAWLYKNRAAEEGNKNLIKKIFSPEILIISFFIGLFHTTNYWDVPIYYVVAGAVILFSNMVVYNYSGKAYLLTAGQGVAVMVLAKIMVLPFTLNFSKIASTPLFVVNRTPLFQFLIIWGLPIGVFLTFLLSTYLNYLRDRNGEKKRAEKKEKAGLASSFMSRLNPSDLFIITLGLCAIGLTILPEIIYMEDIYKEGYKRANTMFKLTYQAYIMFGICFGYIFIRMLTYARTQMQKVLPVIGLLLFILTVGYYGNAVKNWFGNVLDRSGYKTLDATAFMTKVMPEDEVAIQWLTENVEGAPVVLEANGDSYTDYQRISVMTGMPTVMGWYTHERLWRFGKGTTDEQVVQMLNERAEQILTIYTSEDEAAVKELLRKFQVSYLYVGRLEQQKYGELNHERLQSLGTVVFEVAPIEDHNYPTYIVKLDLESD